MNDCGNLQLKTKYHRLTTIFYPQMNARPHALLREAKQWGADFRRKEKIYSLISIH
jgi:hypothetical protein